ncbi:MAG: bifunctional riboflavin kinase/FAD synthetase [Bariatricus sp.]|nr:bifunctional riboflavin kinase/FAD synthetase [Bariatricus sp.]
MEYFKGLDSYRGTGRSAITLGKFDGLHRGHQKLIHKVSQLKEEYGVKSVVFAFDMIPLFDKLGLPREGILSNEERRMHLEGEVDVLVECPFTEKISSIEAEDFIRDILAGLFHAKYVVVGTDFRFGHDKRGDADMLRKYADRYDYEVFVIDKEMYGDREISSTYVREELRKGNMKAVNEMLGYPYTVDGTVEYGKQLGRKLGFPTLNVHPAKEKLLPPNGVYLDRVKLDGTWYDGIGNVGVKPTVTEEKRMLIESYLFDYEGNAYGKNVRIQLYEFKRPERKFESVEEMKHQVDSDIAYGREYFKAQKRIRR